MSLRELQQAFQAHVLLEDGAILPAIVNAPPLEPAARLHIYRAAYVNRLTEALRVTYVKVHQILGDDVFASMAADFIGSHASTTRSIRWYGASLPAFLAQRQPYAEQPVLAELARFEWALAAVFDAADARPLTRMALMRIDPMHWGDLRFNFHSSVRTVSADWNCVAVWQSIDAGVAPPPPAKSGESSVWLLWRQDLKNYFRSLAVDEQTALAGAMDGASFASICERLGQWLPQAAIPARAAAIVAAWADSGILIEL